MSSPERRAQLRRERAVEDEARETEDRRRANLTLWERIEELKIDRDLMDVLHRIANGERED